MNKFDADYYENGINSGLSLYTNYRWIPELTIPMAFRMIEILDIKENDKVLDFGCAKGFLVKVFRLLDRDCYGVDVSEYAIENCDNDIKKYVKKIESASDIDMNYDFVISKDVFEHIDPTSLKNILLELRKKTECMFVIVPLGNGEKYIIDSYELDTTHIIRENKDWWTNLFLECGFKIDMFSYKMKGIKENYNKFETGNGFFILK